MSSAVPFEIWMLAAASVLGALQAFGGAKTAQIQRNFSETYFLYSTAILGLLIVGGFGDWSREGSAIYVAGRSLYAVVTVIGATRFRKWIWAISIVGLVGCLGELARQVYFLVA